MRQFKGRQFRVRAFKIRHFALVTVVPVASGPGKPSTWHKGGHSYGPLTVKGPLWRIPTRPGDGPIGPLPPPELAPPERKKRKKKRKRRDEDDDEGLILILLNL